MLNLPLDAVATLVSESDVVTRELTARSCLAQRLAKETYQRPDDVAAALAMVGVKSIWSTAFANGEQAKVALGVVIDRRNRIVHHCDYDPVQPDAVVPLADVDARDALYVISRTVDAVDPLCG